MNRRLIALAAVLVGFVGVAHAQAPVRPQIPTGKPGNYQDVSNNNPLPTSASGPTGFLQGVTVAGGGARVAQDPTQQFWEDFRTGTLDTAAANNLNHKWVTPATGGGGNATAANNQVAATMLGSGTGPNGWSTFQSQKAFLGRNPAWIYFQENNNFEFPVLTHALRFWGFATFPAAPTVAAPYADAEGFEIGVDGHLRAVTSASADGVSAGTRLVINDLSLACPATVTASGSVVSGSATLTLIPAVTVSQYELVTGPKVPFGTTVNAVSGGTITLSSTATATASGSYTFTSQCAPGLTGVVPQPQDANAHAYTKYVRGDRIFWAIDNPDNVVAQTYTGAPGPNNNALPIGHIAIADATGPSSSATININGVTVGDTGRNEIQICDPTLPQNCVGVSSTGQLSVTGGGGGSATAGSGQIFPITNDMTTTSATTTTGQSIGGLQTLANAVLTSGALGANNSSGYIQNLTVTFTDAIGSGPLDVYYFNANPAGSTCTNDVAFVLANADRDKVIGIAHVTDFTSSNTTVVAQVNNLSMGYGLSSATSIFACVVARASFVIAGTTNASLLTNVLRN
jgi:hypothetical protein